MTPSLELAICSTGEIWGGVEQCIAMLAEGLVARGILPVVVLFNRGQFAEALLAKGIQVELLEGRHPYDLRVIAELKALFRRRQINVAHTHGYKATIVASLAAVGTPLPRLVTTEHGRLEAPADWRSVPAYVRLGVNVGLGAAASWAAVDHVVYVSDDIRRTGNRWRHDGTVIRNGIRIHQSPLLHAPPRPGHDGQSFTIGVVGRLTAVKGHPYLFRALAQLPPSIRLRVFGSGPDEPALRTLATSLGVGDRVSFEGFVTPIQPQLATLDVLAMPSLHEGLPYALLEAMSLGIPVVASRVGGLVEAIEDGVSGRLVPPRDPEALASAIRDILASPREARALAEQARRRVESEFHVDGMVDRYLKVYLQLLES